jgi:hypothetical protein
MRISILLLRDLAKLNDRARTVAEESKRRGKCVLWKEKMRTSGFLRGARSATTMPCKITRQ